MGSMRLCRVGRAHGVRGQSARVSRGGDQKGKGVLGMTNKREVVVGRGRRTATRGNHSPSPLRAQMKGMPGAGSSTVSEEICRKELPEDSFPLPLESRRTLVLDVAHRPISVVNWKRAILMEMLSKAEVLEYYDDVEVTSVNDVFPLPAVMKVCFYVKANSEKATVSRKSIMIRDGYECQYCGSKEDLTIDHVIPVSKGGKWEWNNLVAACSRCNVKKSNKLSKECGMYPKNAPKKPRFFTIGVIHTIADTIVSGKRIPSEWKHYVPTLDVLLDNVA